LATNDDIYLTHDILKKIDPGSGPEVACDYFRIFETYVFGGEMDRKSSLYLYFLLAFLFTGISLTVGCYRKLGPASPLIPLDPAIVTPTGTSTLLTGTPTQTSTPSSPTTTPTITATTTTTVVAVPPTGIFWQTVSEYFYDPATSSGTANVFLCVNGGPEAAAGVTFFTPSGSVKLPYINTQGNAAWYQTNTTLPYAAGQPYTMVTSTSIGIASATVTAPGGSVSVTPDGSELTWASEGNIDNLYVDYTATGSYSYSTVGNINSPYMIPSSAYPGPGTYLLYVFNENNVSVNNAPGSSFQIVEASVLTVTK
jgi:hypothetical protein